MEKLLNKENIKIEDMIHIVRGVQVVLDSDFGYIYDVETKRINEAVRRNADKFPERFSFILNGEEAKHIFLVANCDQKN